jgi:hypothetical protein
MNASTIPATEEVAGTSSSSNPTLSSQFQWNERESFRMRYDDTSDATSTNACSSLTGPGYVFDHKPAKRGRLEAAVDSLSRRLKRRPLKVVLQLSHALVQMHESDSQEPCSEQIDGSMSSTGGLDASAKRLLWSCNGVCPRCGAVYNPKVLHKPPDTVARPMKLLASYLCR